MPHQKTWAGVIGALAIVLATATIATITSTNQRVVLVDTRPINNVRPPFEYEDDHRRFMALVSTPMCPPEDKGSEQPMSAGLSCTLTPTGVEIKLRADLETRKDGTAVAPKDLARGLEEMLNGYEVSARGDVLEVSGPNQTSDGRPIVPHSLLIPWLQLQASAAVLQDPALAETRADTKNQAAAKKQAQIPGGTGPFYIDYLWCRENRREFDCTRVGNPQPEKFGDLGKWLDDVLILKRRRWSLVRTNEIVFVGLRGEFFENGDAVGRGTRDLVQALNSGTVQGVFDVDADSKQKLIDQRGGRPQGWRFTEPRKDRVLVAALQPAGTIMSERNLPLRCRPRLIHALAQVRQDPALLRRLKARPAGQLLPEPFEPVHMWQEQAGRAAENTDNCKIKLLTNASWKSTAEMIAKRVADVEPTIEIQTVFLSPEEESELRETGEYGISMLALVYRPHPPAFYLWNNLQGTGWVTKKHLEYLAALAEREANGEDPEIISAALDKLHQQLDTYLIPMNAPTRVAAVSNRLMGVDPGNLFLNPDELRLAPSATQTTMRFLLASVSVLLLAGAVSSYLTQRASARQTRMVLSLRMFRHDILAPLATIKAQAERVLRREPKVGTALLSEAEAALAVAEDAQFVVQKGKAQARDDTPTNLRDQVIEPVLGTLSRRAFYEKADPPAITLDLLEEAPPVAVPFDFARFVIRVLIENSWRHRGEHPLRLELVGTVSGKKYCLEVRDWGPGIAEEDIKQLFRPGHPSNGSRKEAREGSGMGLYLARSVLRFHGGTIKLRQPANPTTFEVCFPLASKRRGRPTEAPETEAS